MAVSFLNLGVATLPIMVILAFLDFCAVMVTYTLFPPSHYCIMLLILHKREKHTEAAIMLELLRLLWVLLYVIWNQLFLITKTKITSNKASGSCQFNGYCSNAIWTFFKAIKATSFYTHWLIPSNLMNVLQSFPFFLCTRLHLPSGQQIMRCTLHSKLHSNRPEHSFFLSLMPPKYIHFAPNSYLHMML